jgi:hypothetical protein
MGDFQTRYHFVKGPIFSSLLAALFLPLTALGAYILIPVTGIEVEHRSHLAIAQQIVAPTITSIFPGSGPIGTLVTISGAGFTGKNDVNFRNGDVFFLAESPVKSEDGMSLHFHLNPCPSHEPKCPRFFIPPGSYHVTVVNDGGTSNETVFELTSR